MAGSRVEAAGIWLNVVDQGARDGPPVLLVHGFPDDHRVWRAQVQPLVASGFRVILPDTRGRGRSDMAAGRQPYAFGHLVADLVALLDRLDIERVRLVGHDWGSLIGWHFCAAHPERVERYLAISVGHPEAFAAGGWRQWLKSWYIFLYQVPLLPEWMLGRGNGRLLRRIGARHGSGDDYAEIFRSAGRLAAGLGYYRDNFLRIWRPRLPAVDVPVMAIFGRRDPYLDEAHMHATAQLVRAAWRLEVLPDAGHWPQLERPERMNALVLDYLGRAASSLDAGS